MDQFLIVVTFTLTINKAQGQSLKHALVYFPQPVFGHGQLYFALSQATSVHGLTDIHLCMFEINNYVPHLQAQKPQSLHNQIGPSRGTCTPIINVLCYALHVSSPLPPGYHLTSPCINHGLLK